MPIYEIERKTVVREIIATPENPEILDLGITRSPNFKNPVVYRALIWDDQAIVQAGFSIDGDEVD